MSATTARLRAFSWLLPPLGEGWDGGRLGWEGNGAFKAHAPCPLNGGIGLHGDVRTARGAGVSELLSSCRFDDMGEQPHGVLADDREQCPRVNDAVDHEQPVGVRWSSGSDRLESCVSPSFHQGAKRLRADRGFCKLVAGNPRRSPTDSTEALLARTCARMDDRPG